MGNTLHSLLRIPLNVVMFGFAGARVATLVPASPGRSGATTREGVCNE